MDLQNLLRSLENCPCGKEHTFDTKVVEIYSGLTADAGKILSKAGFPKKLLLVADDNTFGVAEAEGLTAALEASGFELKKLIYKNMKYARIEQVREVEALAADVDGVISVGTGSLNDICRVATFELDKKFCIFATAPSMDGFASDTAPIIENNFKNSWKARQPMVILADTKILAAAPTELKAAGYGDMVAKYIGIVDWKIANLLIGEYYCQNVANVTLSALQKCIDLTDKVTANDEEAAGAIMEALVLSGLAMKLALSSRPASGAEHVVSHYWECYKVTRGIWPEFHGKKVGVATLIINRMYRNIAERVTEINPVADRPDWDDIYAHFTPDQIPEVKKLNNPSICDKVDLDHFKKVWPEIRKIILEDLPDTDVLYDEMKRAGCATEPEEVHVDKQLLADGLRYHSYMRYRILVTRLMPMLGLDPLDFID
ncbi:MAG: sn-glycerol-1-phosphate dehydrogenase [Clostridia bacterium]|nr:sn-glycerol-1-phosphate dehydrogenase [Clostridia bacterium]